RLKVNVQKQLKPPRDARAITILRRRGPQTGQPHWLQHNCIILPSSRTNRYRERGHLNFRPNAWHKTAHCWTESSARTCVLSEAIRGDWSKRFEGPVSESRSAVGSPTRLAAVPTGEDVGPAGVLGCDWVRRVLNCA